MIRTRFLAAAAAFGFALSAAAWAQQATTTRTAFLRAGPAPDFPLVARLSPGTPVYIEGCLSDYQWCDVEVGATRGWLNTRTLQTYYGRRYVPLYSYAPTIGFPCITFSLGSYWDNWYRGRPFYGERPRWEQRWYSYSQPRYNYGRPNEYRGPRVAEPPRVTESPRIHQYQYSQPSPRIEYQREQPRFQQPSEPQRFVPRTTPEGGRLEQRGNRLIEQRPNGQRIDRTPNDTEHQGQ